MQSSSPAWRASPSRCTDPRLVGRDPSVWENRRVMADLPLVFDAPKRALPPTHFADLDQNAVRAAVTALGLPAYRADQLARQYYGRFESDVATMTDLPAAA